MLRQDLKGQTNATKFPGLPTMGAGSTNEETCLSCIEELARSSKPLHQLATRQVVAQTVRRYGLGTTGPKVKWPNHRLLRFVSERTHVANTTAGASRCRRWVNAE